MPCTQFPVGGQDGIVCKMHGGFAPQVIDGVGARARTRQMREIESVLSRLVAEHLAQHPGPPLLPPRKKKRKPKR